MVLMVLARAGMCSLCSRERSGKGEDTNPRSRPTWGQAKLGGTRAGLISPPQSSVRRRCLRSRRPAAVRSLLRGAKIRISDDKAGLLRRPTHRRQSLISSSRCACSGGTSAVAIRATSSSVKSPARSTRRSRRRSRSYASADRTARRPQPSLVIVTGSTAATPKSPPASPPAGTAAPRAR